MRRVGLLVVIAVLAACGGGGSSTVPTSTPSSTATSEAPSADETVTASPRSTRATGVLTRLVDEPVVDPADGERYTNPGVVIEQEGTLHLLLNSFSRWPGDSVVHHHTSTDGGTTWELADPDPVLTNGDVPYADRIAFVTAAVIEDDGSWTAYLYTYDGETTRAVIGRATAPGPGGPWTVDPEPVLEPGEDGAWDGVRLAEPAVARTDDGYVMWFVGFGRGSVAAIGMATSADGITWTKRDGPVFTGEEPWTQGSVDGPQVLPTADGYRMTYGSPARRNFTVGVATSPDGINWTPLSGNPVLNRDDVGATFFQSELFRAGDHIRYLLEIATGDETTKLFLYDASSVLVTES
jgi:predicted GH43/DUF377 family glycosyl hydrolase